MKILRKVMILIALIVISVGIFGVTTQYSKSVENVWESKREAVAYKENIQQYETENGMHTIYWMQGINPPKMTNDPNLLGTKGYFGKDVTGDFVTYQAEFQPGNGYFDYNKNLDLRGDEHPLCYLGSASNLISWWLEQNKVYVAEYINRLENTDIYGQYEGLYPIKPFDKKMWQEITSGPRIEVQNGYKAQKLGVSPLVTKYLKPYYYKKDVGYFDDMVIDFFFNGYDAIPTLDYPKPNTEENFVKDPRGGFFFPIFGKKKISQRLTGSQYSDYEYFNKNLRKLFAEGKGVSFGYEVNAIKAHAITVWGAEYDENNKLCRVFITDTDDFQPAKLGDEYWRGMVGFNTVADKNGKMCITNSTKINPEKPGNYVTKVITIDLAQDILKAKLADTLEPVKPTIVTEPKDSILALNSERIVKVEAKTEDAGFLEYEWYVSNDRNSKGTVIPRENKSTLKIDTKTLGVKYYYCVVKNIKNGKTAKTETSHFKVEVKDIEVVNAETPKISFNYNTVTVKQHSTPIFKVTASVNDGGTLSYQWYQANDNSAVNGRKLEGETRNVFYPPTNNVSNGLYYYCEITNTNMNENITGKQKVTVKTPYSKKIIIEPAELLNAAKPIIIEQPQNITVENSEKQITLSVSAKVSDGGKLSYQWYEVNSDYSEKIIVGETKNTFTPRLISGASTMYKCKITNTNNLVQNNKETSIFTDTVTVEVKGEILSNDCSIQSLKVSNSKLTPEFNKDVYIYNAIIPHKDNELNLNVVANPKATVTIDNPIINIGETKNVSIKVTAEDGSIKTYTIRVSRDTVHNYDKWEIVKNATCTENGQEKRKCIVCGNEEIREIEAKGHNWNTEWTIDKEATCNVEGSKSHHCKDCNAKKDETVISKTAHNYGKWKVISSKNNINTERRICSVCGQYEERQVTIIEEQKEDNNITSNNSNSNNSNTNINNNKNNEDKAENQEKVENNTVIKHEEIPSLNGESKKTEINKVAVIGTALALTVSIGGVLWYLIDKKRKIK